MLVQCDNLAVVHMINAQSGRDKTVMHLLRGVHFFCAVFEFRLKVEHLPGHLNGRADAISCNKLQALFREVPPVFQLGRVAQHRGRNSKAASSRWSLQLTISVLFW